MNNPTISHTVIATTSDISVIDLLFLVIVPLAIFTYTLIRIYQYHLSARQLPAKDKRVYTFVQVFTVILACMPLYFLLRYVSNFFVVLDFSVGGWLFTGFSMLILFGAATMCAIFLLILACLAYLRKPTPQTLGPALPGTAPSHTLEYVLLAILAAIIFIALIDPLVFVYSIFLSPFILPAIAFVAYGYFKVNRKK